MFLEKRVEILEKKMKAFEESLPNHGLAMCEECYAIKKSSEVEKFLIPFRMIEKNLCPDCRNIY